MTDTERLVAAFMAAGWSQQDSDQMAKQAESSDVFASLEERAVYLAHIWGEEALSQRKKVVRRVFRDASRQPRYSVTTGDSFDDYGAWALGFVSRQELVYLDDPHGNMVGFVVTARWNDVLDNLNRDLTTEQRLGEGFAWRIHEPDADNYVVLIRRLADDAILGDAGPRVAMLHDNEQSEVVGFLFAERAVELEGLLNR